MRSSGNKVEPIAIVGIACRFPGELENIQKLWEGLRTRYSAITETPTERWSADRYYSKNHISKGKTYVRRGGYLKRDPRLFDAAFFGISPRDAENMDPQQRLMLEVVWEAFENAGIRLPEHARRPVGVYVGGFMLDHMITQTALSNRSAINQYSAAGMMMTMLSNRVSHTFDFRGPSLSIDTACSSSLVAFHYACQDIWSGACEMAVVGGVNVMMRPEYPIGMCKGHFLAQDGECKSFDQRGDGYGRAEGAGVVLLKPLSKAIECGNDICATVIATGTNQDGHTPGISMPNGEAQRALIEDVCDKFAIDPKSIHYVECHGTGTAIGDPTEARAIGATYGKDRSTSSPVLIGSIKSNLGHMEAGAGIAGIIKATLTLHHRETSPLANLQTPNPAIDFQGLGIKLSDDNYPLTPIDAQPIRAAVNSFGYGGSNAHVILEEFRIDASMTRVAAVDNPRCDSLLLPITARSKKAVQDTARVYLELLESGTQARDLIYSVIRRRSMLNQRAIIAAKNDDQLKEHLKAFLNDQSITQVATGQSPYSGQDRPVFVFTGMGPQWWAMGQELYAIDPVYRNAVEEADAVFQSISGFSALEEMLKDEQSSEITKTEFAQPANFLIQIGLTAILKSRGIEPAACVGHSVGELASAYVTGALSLRDAMTVCFHRSQQQAKAKGAGSMIAVALDLNRANELVETYSGAVSIAAINGVSNITLAGDTDCIVDISQMLTSEGIFNRRLEVEVPYHGPAMEPLMQPLAEALRSIQPMPPSTALYSTVTGQRVQGIAYGSDYWPANIRQPVEFVRAIQNAIQDGYSIFIEVGPHPVLSTSLKECIQTSGKDCRQLFTLRRKTSEMEAIDRCILEYFASGGRLNWENTIANGKIIPLPNYCWQREMLWLENDRAAQDRMNPIVHPMLGTQEAPGTYSYRNDFEYDLMRYLQDHKVMGLSILPAAGYIASFFEMAAIQMSDASGWVLRDFEIAAPLIIKEDRAIDFVTTYDPITQMVVCRSLENGKLGSGVFHAVGKIAPCSIPSQQVSLNEWIQNFGKRVEIGDFYKQLASIGLQYGPAFQSVQELRLSGDSTESCARVQVPANAICDRATYRIHPALMDGCFQTLMAMINTHSTTYLPTKIDEIRLFTAYLPEQIWCHGKLQTLNHRFVECHIDLYDMQGQLVASIKNLRANAAAKLQRTDKWGDPVKLQILNYQWKVGENLHEPTRLGNWLVIGDQTDLSPMVCQQLENFGATVCGHVHFASHLDLDGREIDVRPESVEDWLAVFQRCDELNGIVFTNPIDACAQPDDPTGVWQLRRIVTALQAFLQSQRTDSPRIYVVTQGAFRVLPNDSEVNPSQSSMNGFTRVAFNELDVDRISSIDLPGAIDAASFESLIQELICDGEEDEIAIRDGQRFVSELMLTDALSRDLTSIKPFSLSTAIRIRSGANEEDIGTIKIFEDEFAPLEANQVRLMVEKCTLPIVYLNGAPEEIIERPWMEVVATICDVGCNVAEFKKGMRVAGFFPSDGVSHLTLDWDAMLAVEIDHDASASHIVAGLGDLTRAIASLSQISLDEGMCAAVEACPLGVELARLLVEQRCRVVLIAEPTQSIELKLREEFSIISKDNFNLDLFVSEHTGGKGFELMAVNATEWSSQIGWLHLASGGTILDLSPSIQNAGLPATLGTYVRTAPSVLASRPKLMRQSIHMAVTRLQLGHRVDSAFFEVSVSDLAWKKLPFNEKIGTLILSMEPREVDLPMIQNTPLALRQGAYLITGGLGGFGQQTARWLVQQGVRHLVLTGRKGADSPEKESFVHDLESMGVQTLAVACDACDRMAVRSLLRRIQDEMPPLRGIIHSAAAIIDEPIHEINLEHLSSVMNNKALAAWILHEETKDIPLDHFILYSSAANLVGNSRQSIYSAANGFLDGLAHYRRQAGLPGISINWGAIGDVGIIARDEKLEQFLRYVGLSGMNSAEALEHLKLAISRDVVQVGVLLMKSWAEWGRFEVRAGKSPRFFKLIAADSTGGNSESRNALVEELSQLDSDQQLEVLLALVTDVIAGILKTNASSLHPSKPISEYGVDSLMATEIQLSLEQTMGLKVAVLELLGDSTILSLTRNALQSLPLDSSLAVRK